MAKHIGDGCSYREVTRRLQTSTIAARLGDRRDENSHRIHQIGIAPAGHRRVPDPRKFTVCDGRVAVVAIDGDAVAIQPYKGARRKGGLLRPVQPNCAWKQKTLNRFISIR